MKAVYLGNWMANAWRTKDKAKDYEDIEDYIFSLAPKFGLDQYMNHQETDGNKYYPTMTFEKTTDVHSLHDAYDEETFWDELINRLGEIAFYKKYTKQQIKKMSQDERFTKLYECIDKIGEKMEKEGLESLTFNSN